MYVMRINIISASPTVHIFISTDGFQRIVKHFNIASVRDVHCTY